jgi:hypothetical protein
MATAALPTGVQYPSDGGLETIMRVGNDTRDATQATMAQAAQEFGPERSASLSPVVMPSTSRRPSVLTATATITATDTMRWSRRALT